MVDRLLYAVYAVTLIVLLVSRILFLIFREQPQIWDIKSKRRLKTLIVLGSGGHTAEMMSLVRALPCDVYAPRCYVVAKTDGLSADKALRAEEESGSKLKEYDIVKIPRSREVGQSWTSSVGTTLRAFLSCILLVAGKRPDL
ncbi:hypothetical protein CYMTET_19312, partial [Cymbomonas tetramitiformis]